MWAWRLAGLVPLCSVAASAGWAAGCWVFPTPSARLGVGPRALWIVLYALWCLSWLPTVVGMLSEAPGQRDTPGQTAIRVLCAANAILYYVGGGTWLVVRSCGASGALVVPAWAACCLSNSFGPVTLLLAKVILDAAPQGPQAQNGSPAGR